MSVISRGIKNTFRNGLRTLAFSIILAVSMGMAFSMLLANQAVHARLDDLRARIGNTILVHPAGIFGSQGGGKPLTEAEVDKLATLPHVVRVNKNIDFLIKKPEPAPPENSSNFSTQSSGEILETSLVTALQPLALGEGVKLPAGQKLPPPPINVDGISGPYESNGKPLRLQTGRQLKKDDTYSALVGKTLATKNNLVVGSTFKIKDKVFTVAGIIDNETEFAGNALKIPFATAQELTGRKGQVLAATLQIDSIDNLESIKKEVTKALGKDRADITSTQPEALQAIEGLQSIERVSFLALLISLGAGVLTVFLTMLIVVRERTKEIGVLKALGASNFRIITQFTTEATALTFTGTLLGMGIALLSGNAILLSLLSSKMDNSNSGAPGTSSMVQATGGTTLPQNANNLLDNIVTLIDWHLIVYGLVVALGIAIIGSAIPSWLVARVRPAKVMRSN